MDWLEFCAYLTLTFGGIDSRTCEHIAITAQDFGACPYTMLAIGWHESRWDNTAISGSYVGALQVNPVWVEDCEDCDEIALGVKLFLQFKHKDKCLWISRYMNGWSGTCDERALKRVNLASKFRKMHLKLANKALKK
jgi:hypothetical protein